MAKFNWLTEIDWERLLPEEHKEIADTIGIEAYIKLLTEFQKSTISMTTLPVLRLLPHYIRRFPDTPSKRVAREIGLSVRQIQRVKRKLRMTN